MSPAVVGAAAVVVALLAALSSHWVRTLATEPSRWTGPLPLALLGALGGAVAGVVAQRPAQFAALAALALGGALLCAVDLACHRLPDRVTLPTAVLVLAGLAIDAGTAAGWGAFGRAVAAGAVVGGAFLLLALISPRALGLGDVKLAALLAVAAGSLGWTAVLGAVVVAFVLGGLVALTLLVSGRASRTTAIPFGPWLIGGAAIAMVLVRLTPTG